MFMLLTGGAGLAASAGPVRASGSGNPHQNNSSSTDGYDIGGRRIVGEDGYATIETAWEAAEDGDTVYVHSSYDAQTAGEEFPIVLDYGTKQVTLTGGHPSGSIIDAGDVDENVIEVIGTGSSDYRNNPVVRNLRIEGGNIGLRVRCAPYASFENLVLYNTGSHGTYIDSHSDGGTFGTNWFNCQAWNCGGDGFREKRSADPHATAYFGCQAIANRGVGFRLRGTASHLSGGTTQLNHSYGVEVRSGRSVNVSGVYIEGNARSEDYPVEIYATRADGLLVDGCYFHGINPRGANHDYTRVQRGVNVHDTSQITVRDNFVRRYGNGFIAIFGCSDGDMHSGSHCLDDAELFGVDPTSNGNVRIRSDGMILPTDLSSIDGAHEYDCGYHVGSDGSEGHAVWYDGEWHLAQTTTL